LNAAVNSTAELEQKEGRTITVGNSTEGALLQWLAEAGIDYESLRERFPSVYQMHFSSERKRMATVLAHDSQFFALVKGAPEILLEKSSSYLAPDGSVRPWSPESRAAVEAWLRDSASQAMRTLAFGYVGLPPGTPTDEESLHARAEELAKGLVFTGLVAIHDPLREDVKEAVGRCRAAGIEVKMITGDNVETARAIACEIGLVERRDAPFDTDDAPIYTSPKFNELHQQLQELKKRDALTPAGTERKTRPTRELSNLHVLAPAPPLDKSKMVELLQEQQQV